MTHPLGVGLHADSALPVPGQAIGVWTRSFGVVESGGVADSWSPLLGAAAPWVAAGAARPAVAPSSLEFDGIDDAMTQAALATSGLAAASWAAWLRQDTQAADAIPLESANYPTGLLTVCRTSTFIDAFSAHPSEIARSTGPLPAAQWAFYAQVYDGGAAAGQKTRIFLGTTPANVADVTAFDNTTQTTLPAATGTALLGGRATVYFDGGISFVALYGIALSLQQLRQLAAFERP